MQAVDIARAVPGRGLEGDRYCTGTGTFSPPERKPDHELTLIESEAIAAFRHESRLDFTPVHARRNLVTVGVRLNDLVGVEFTIGAIRIRGLRRCEPCNHLAKTTYPEVLRGLLHRGGLRAQILTAGTLHVGDLIAS